MLMLAILILWSFHWKLAEAYYQEIVSRHDIYIYLLRTAVCVNLKEAIAARPLSGLAIPPLRPT